MHSRIFELRSKPINKEDYIKTFTFEDELWFVGGIADYVSDDVNREKDIEWLVRCLENTLDKKHIKYNEEEQSITFLKGFKQSYFLKVFNEFKELSSSMTLDDYMDSFTSYKIRSLVEDRYGFYAYDDDLYLKPFDEFVRGLKDEEVKVYLGGVIDYHY